MPDQSLLRSMLVLLFHARTSQCTPAVMDSERGSWCCDTPGTAPQTYGTSGNGSCDREGQHTSGEGVDRLGKWGGAACLTCLIRSLQVHVTCMVMGVSAR